MNLVGYSLCLLTSGSWVTECSGLSLDGSVDRLLLAVWMSSRAYVIFSMVARVKSEDEMLRKEFGGDWDKWARQVPYKLIPFVY